MKEYIINKIYEFRTKLEMTQEELAEKIEVSRQTIIAIEKGNYTPSVNLALRLACFFEVPVEEIFKLTNENNEK